MCLRVIRVCDTRLDESRGEENECTPKEGRVVSDQRTCRSEAEAPERSEGQLRSVFLLFLLSSKCCDHTIDDCLSFHGGGGGLITWSIALDHSTCSK